MIKHLIFICLLSLLISCNSNDDTIEDPTPDHSHLKIEASHSEIPFNGYGKVQLSASADFERDMTSKTTFIADGQVIEGNVFTPSKLGTVKIKGVYKDLESSEIELKVAEPLNKKVLIELFTARTCGWCPWISLRVDSLDKNNSDVIGYRLHGEDELQIPEVPIIEDYLKVYGRPAVRLNRGYVRNYDAPIEIKELLDSIEYFLSYQPKVEIAIHSNLNQNLLSVTVFSKHYKPLYKSVYLTVLLVEDPVFTSNQFNYFSGSSHNSPLTESPDPIPNYENHQVLREVFTEALGNSISIPAFEEGAEQQIGEFQIPLSENWDPQHLSIIAFLHHSQTDIEQSTVLNAQIVKAGSSVSFKE